MNEALVIARNPKELKAAQSVLLEWTQKKIEHASNDLVDLRENFEVAKKNKWRTTPWKRRVSLAEKLLAYYEKIKVALKAGYYVVPNFPIDVISIRTDRKKPLKNHISHRHYSVPTNDQKTNSPPKGQGQHVDPSTVIEEKWETEEEDGNGKEVTRYHAEAEEFLSPDFPIATVKPQILKEVSRAQAIKVFDEIGILPARRSVGDPMVVGRIVHRVGYSEKSMSFLISWWINQEDF